MGQFFLFLTHLLFFCHPELVSGSHTDKMLKQACAQLDWVFSMTEGSVQKKVRPYGHP